MADAVMDIAGLDSSTENTQSVETQADETLSTGNESTENLESQQQETPQQITGKAIRDAVRMAAEQFPEQAKLFKQLADTHFRENAYKQIFDTSQAAQAAKQLIEGAGGLEGITKLQERIGGYETMDSQLSEGNPEVLETFFKDFQQGAVALAPAYLEKLSQVNPQAFNEAIGPYAVDMVVEAGFLDTLKDAYDNLSNVQGSEQGRVIIAKMYNWLAGQSQARDNIRRNGGTQGVQQNDHLKQEREAIAKEKDQLFISSAAEKANTRIDQAITAEIQKYANTYKLTDDQKTAFGKYLARDLMDALSNDKNYLGQVDLRKRAKDRDAGKMADYIVSAYKERIPQAAFALAKTLYGAKTQASSQTGVAKANAPKATASGGPLFVSQRPPDSELDLSRPGADMDLIKGRAYTKAGRYITWRK